MVQTEMRPDRPHTMVVEERGLLRLTGVNEVERFDEGEILISTVEGRLAVRGQGLRVVSLRVESGELTVEGSVDGCVYLSSDRERGSVWSRLFG